MLRCLTTVCATWRYEDDSAGGIVYAGDYIRQDIQAGGMDIEFYYGRKHQAVMEAAGIRDIRAKCLRSNNPQNVVSATFEGLKALRTPEEVARTRGKSVDEIVG